MKLDAKAKRLIRKDLFSTCAYVYRDGIAVTGQEEHFYKGDKFTKDFVVKFEGEIPIYTNRDEFVGRIVVHNPTLLLDGIESIYIYYDNSSQTMRDMNLTCTTVTLKTKQGLNIKHDIFHFMSSDFTIQNGSAKSVNDWD